VNAGAQVTRFKWPQGGLKEYDGAGGHNSGVSRDEQNSNEQGKGNLVMRGVDGKSRGRPSELTWQKLREQKGGSPEEAEKCGGKT